MAKYVAVDLNELLKGMPPSQLRRLPKLRKEYATRSHENLVVLTAIFRILLEDMSDLTKKVSAANDTNRTLVEQRHAALQELNAQLTSALKSAPRRAAKRATRARWSRLEPVKKLAFERRKQFAHLKRSPAIDKFLPEILEACRAAGEPLSGGNPKETVERWFRKAAIK